MSEVICYWNLVPESPLILRTGLGRPEPFDFEGFMPTLEPSCPREDCKEPAGHNIWAARRAEVRPLERWLRDQQVEEILRFLAGGIDKICTARTSTGRMTITDSLVCDDDHCRM